MSFQVPVVTVRPFNTFGPRQSARAVIPTILTQLLTGLNPIRLGSLSPVRDLVFVEDTVHGFLALGKCDAAVGHTVNIGTGKGVTIKELADMSMNVTGHTVEIECEKERVRPDMSEVMNLICNPTLLQKLTGWHPDVSLDVGLGRTAKFIAERIETYRVGEYVL
jgi:nucleoside-diphosphate-sugar epimerase